jgi:hypothetical protein
VTPMLTDGIITTQHASGCRLRLLNFRRAANGLPRAGRAANPFRVKATLGSRVTGTCRERSAVRNSCGGSSGGEEEERTQGGGEGSSAQAVNESGFAMDPEVGHASQRPPTIGETL